MTSCPKCGSDDARKVSVIFEQGTTVNKMDPMVGVGGGGGHLGLGVVAGVRWKGQSALAARLTPPTRTRDAVAAGWSVFILGAILGIAATAPWWLVIGIIVGVTTYGLIERAQKPAYQRALARWNRQWCCMRCGEVFEVKKDGSEMKRVEGTK